MELYDASEADLDGILAIYNDVILHTTAVYSEIPVTLEDRLKWYRTRRELGYPVLVAADETGVIGFASFGDFRAWPCYRHTVEHSVHVRPDKRGLGVGRRLVEQLLLLAAQSGKHVMLAGIDSENAASIHLHQRLGFESVAHFREVARKFDRWLDLVFMQRIL
jgi:L-amino acid N-acyltransferase